MVSPPGWAYDDRSRSDPAGGRTGGRGATGRPDAGHDRTGLGSDGGAVTVVAASPVGADAVELTYPGHPCE